jgi:AcrR family transcriptional regulator
MAGTEAPKRRYESPRRREQAAATRRDVLEAAKQLFEQQGYPSTTMAAIAKRAGVSEKTVYLAFETKSRLLRALWDILLRGEPDIPVADQPWYREVLDEPDARRQLQLNAQNSARRKSRIGAILQVLRNAAPVDADAAALWNLIQTDFHANQGAIVLRLDEAGALKPGLDVARATDILWSLNHPDVWHLLVDLRGWSPDEYERWFAETSCSQLLDDSRREASS